MIHIAVAVIVPAYIIHYGVHLQDEVDHTLKCQPGDILEYVDGEQ